jgi:hypothetical protein
VTCPGNRSPVIMVDHPGRRAVSRAALNHVASVVGEVRLGLGERNEFERSRQRERGGFLMGI